MTRLTTYQLIMIILKLADSSEFYLNLTGLNLDFNLNHQKRPQMYSSMKISKK